MTSVGIMASSKVAGPGPAILTDPCDNFTAAPWVTAGSPTIVAGGFVGNGFSIPASAAATVSYDIPAPQQTDQLTIGFRIKCIRFNGATGLAYIVDDIYVRNDLNFGP